MGRVLELVYQRLEQEDHSDHAAVEKAAQLHDDRDLEVWQAARFVARIAASA